METQTSFASSIREAQLIRLGIGAVVCELSCKYEALTGIGSCKMLGAVIVSPKDLPALKFPGDPNDEVTELHFEQQSPLPQCSPW